MADNDAALRDQLYQLLRGGNAHVDVFSALKDFPAELYGVRPQGAAHSAWELLEHMRIALRDLWDFSTNAKYVEQKWPDDYWPASAAPSSEEAWHSSVRALEEDMELFGQLVKDPHSNLYAKIPWGKDGQTLLREVLLAADHNSYHTGELVFLRRILGSGRGNLLPAYGELPAHLALGGFAEDAFELHHLAEYGRGFGSQGGGEGFEVVEEGADGDEAVFRGKPLGRRQGLGPFGIACTFFEKQRHGVFIGGKEFEQGFDADALRHLFERVFVASERSSVDEDVETGIFTLDDNVQGSAHRQQFIASFPEYGS